MEKITKVISFIIMVINIVLVNGAVSGNVEKGYLVLDCYGKSLEDLSSSYSQTVNVAKLELIDCTTSEFSYAATLERLNIRVKELSLQYDKISIETSYNATYFENLTISELLIGNILFSRSSHNNLSNTEFIKPLYNLKSLSITGINVPSLPVETTLEKVFLGNGKSIGEWGGCKELRELHFLEWNLDPIPERWLANCSKLTLIMLRNIKLTSNILRNLVGDLTSLSNLKIENCNLYEFPAELVVYGKYISDIEFVYNHFNNLSLSHIKMDFLKTLRFQMNNIGELQGLPFTQMKELHIDLYGNDVKIWRLQDTDLKILNNMSLVAQFNRAVFDCNCQNALFARAVRDRRLRIDMRDSDIPKCLDGATFESVPRENLECDRFECSNCTCQRQWSDNSTVARCGGTATRVPRVRGLRALHAAGNLIETLSAEDLPDTLLMVDLNRNSLSSIEKNATLALFSVKERIVHLAGNPFTYHCENQFLIEMLQKQKNQVADYDKLWCIDGDRIRSIHSVVPSELCAAELKLTQQVGLYVAVAVCTILLGLAVVIGVFYCRYRQHLKVYLFARGYCMWCLHEEEVDSDRQYDAFISFSHDNEEFVIEELLPQLDSEYKLCLHYRDWVVGEFIPAQITRSVEQSRRTIIVLSKNFVRSVWGLLEFRTAHLNALSEGRARIIVIVLDDVVDDEGLDPELRNYIRTNTYVRWGDKWFWDKLRYAMPHRRTSLGKHVSTQPTPAMPLQENL